MSATLIERQKGKVLEIVVSGKLRHEDYETLVPEFEELLAEHGKLRLLFHMHDFHGWEMMALWDDVKFDLKHFRDIDRLAIVGDAQWERGMATFCKPFTTATIHYFDESDIDDARRWLSDDLA